MESEENKNTASVTDEPPNKNDDANDRSKTPAIQRSVAPAKKGECSAVDNCWKHHQPWREVLSWRHTHDVLRSSTEQVEACKGARPCAVCRRS